MKVLVNGPTIGAQPTGPGVHMRELFRAVLRADAEVRLRVRGCSLRHAGEAGRTAAAIGPRVHAVTTRCPRRILSPAQSLLGLPSERFLAGGFDVYHQLHTDTYPAVPARRLIVTLHDTVALRWPREEGDMARCAPRVLRRAQRVVTVSEFAKSEIVSAFGLESERVRVIPNGVDAALLTWPAPVRTGPPYIVFVGGCTPRKNLPTLVQAFAMVVEDARLPELKLVLLGPAKGAEPQLRALLPSGLQGNVEFRGFVPEQAKRDCMAGASLLAQLSSYEGFGLPVLEAMALGVPVVAARASALPEVLGDLGRLVDPGSVDDVASAMISVLQRPSAEASSAAAAGRRHAAGYSWDRAARELLDVYREVTVNA